jgi:hypothetical protein
MVALSPSTPPLLSQRLNLKAGSFYRLHDLSGRGLSCVYGQYFIGIGSIDLPVIGTYFLVEGGRDGPDAAAAVDSGFETKR